MRFICFIVVLLAACATKSQWGGESTPDLTQAVLIGSAHYRDSLQVLPNYEFESNRRGLDIFSRSIDKNDSSRCDKALKDFLSFQKKLIDELNQQLYARADFDTINTLIWADTTLYAQSALTFQNELRQQGLLIRSTEGGVYIDADMEPIREIFYKYLTSSTKLFFDQFALESNQGIAEDGGMYISERELADRLGFWEEFIMNNPGHIFKDFAEDNVKYYRYYLMVGMDNTPAFDFESRKLLTAYKQALIYYQQRFGKTPGATIFKKYLTLVETNNDMLVGEAAQFADSYTPWE
ncbi:MAG: hypothetical protein J0L67_09925 [Cytophagales bacterium]|nr:hypothetical protein [Cytophagales bacterium]